MHPFRRADALRRLGDETFDVLVVGGGITGAGVALDAASRGLKTALVEKGDFASGTSSKSSKMIHGGIRYLQQREFRLVYENLAERQRLLDNTPHLVSPLPFLIPLFGRDGVVSKTVARSYATALWLYDLTGGWRIGKRHREVTKREALAHLPTLSTDHLVAGFLYFDARADDARLTLTVARTAAYEFGAVIANYTPVVRLTTGADGTADGAVVRPMPGDESSEFAIRARIVVNATGVWADPCGPSTRAKIPRRFARPRASTSPCRRTGCRATSPRSSPSPTTNDPSSSCRGRTRTSSMSAPPTRTTPARWTIRPVPPRMSTTCSMPPMPSPPRTSPGPTSPASGPDCVHSWPHRPRAAMSPNERPTSHAATPSAPPVMAW